MREGILLVFMNPSSEAKDEEYRDWYDNVHMKEACAEPGVERIVRYKISDNQVHRAGPPPYKYLALHYLNDMDTAIPALSSANFTMSDAVDNTNVDVVVFEPEFEEFGRQR